MTTSLDVADTTKQRVKVLFDTKVNEWAAMYASDDPEMWSAQDLITRRRFALEMIESSVPRGSRVLDVGCGTGDMSAELMRSGYEVWGFDLAGEMVRYVRERLGADRFHVGDAEHINFPDSHFDAIVCLGVLEYLDRDEPALREIHRVLKPNGKAVISTPNALCVFHHTDRVIEALFKIVRPIYRLFRAKKQQTSPAPRVKHRRYHQSRWFRLLRKTGLEPETWLRHSWGWYTLAPYIGQTSLCRASERFARNPAINWLANTHIVRVNAVK